MTCAVVTAAMLPSPCGARGGKRQRDGEEREEEEEVVRYLLRELWVVQGGLKDASGKDWKRDKGTT